MKHMSFYRNARSFKRNVSVLCAAALVCSVSLPYTQGLKVNAAGTSNLKVSANINKGQNVSQNTTTDIGLVGNLFCVGDTNAADHAALQWATTLSASKFTLYRSTNADNGFYPIYEGEGNSFEDDDMKTGKTYYYQLKASNGSNEWYSSVCSLSPVQVSNDLNTYDNQKGSSLVYEKSGTKIGDTYYSYSLKNDSGNAYLVERTSKDGINFGNERVVADKNQNWDLAECKIESVQMRYMEKTGQMVIWAHWEKKDGYSDGKALVITGTPGGDFTVHHVYNPLGVQVRDMTIFVDDDQTGYLVAASNEQGQSANATIYVFKMNENYNDITQVVKKVHENKYREFPNMIKKDGYYYLFTSQTAGWYPSAGGYTVTKDLYGDWSELRSIGNSSTFSSQSGWIVNLNDGKNYLMHAYRWLKASGTSGTTLCPLYFANGFAFYDYYPSFKYSTKTGELYPVQTGELLSQDKQVCASIPSKSETSAEKAFDGSYTSSFTASAKTWPYYLQTDLGEVCDLSNIQTSWYMCKGSEGYYTYTVEGSVDGQNWTTILDHTNKSEEIVSKTYGFNSDMLSGKARYVRLNVKNATLHNNPNNNWYTPTVFEVKVFGNPTGENKQSKPIAQYDFENANSNQVYDISGNGKTLELCGNAKVKNDWQRGNVLYLDGSSNTYAKLPWGLLDGCRDFTVSMDVKSESTGNFFTFAAGKDDNKYLFFKIGEGQLRFAVSKNTWKGESGFKYDVSGNQWHNYTIVVNGSTAKLYLDGEQVSQTTELTTSLADLDSGLECVIGKSFYSADNYFKGYIDNVSIYKTALNADEVNVMLNGEETVKDISECDVKLSSDSCTFNGNAVTPDVVVEDGSKTLVKDTDYTVSYSDNVKAGTATVTITGEGDYSGTVKKTFQILEKSLKYCRTELNKTSFTFTGNKIEPTVSVKIGSNVLDPSNYTVSYINNTKAGTATVKITGKNNLKGTVTKTFDILEKSLKYCNVSLSGYSFNYTGKEIKPSVTVKIGQGVIYSGNYSVSYKNNKEKGTATVTITGKNNLAGSVTKTFKIK